MTVCKKIADCILKNCTNLVQGVKDKAYFINYEDVDKDLSTFDPDNALLLTQLVLKTISPPAYAYCVQGFNFSNEHNTAMVKRTYQKSWDHNFIFRIFDNTPEDKLWINEAVGSRFMVIIENNYSKVDTVNGNGRTVFEVLGWDFGLELNAVERNANDEETLGGWVLTAGSSDTLKESMPPLSFYATDLATTRLAIDALVAPCCE